MEKQILTKKEFDKIISKDEIVFNNYIFNSFLSNVKYDYKNELDFSQLIKKDALLSFNNCEFLIDVVFKNIVLKQKGKYFLNNVIFRKNVLFDNIDFENDINIYDVKFMNELGIFSCDFKGPLEFEKVEINELIINRKTGHERNNKFNERVIFNCLIKNKSIIKDSFFMTVNFNDFKSIGYSLFDNIEFHNLAQFRYINFSKETIFHNCDLTHCSFLFSRFDDVNFTNCTFNFKYLVDERIKDPSKFPREEVLCYEIDQDNKIRDIKTIDLINCYRMFENNYDKYKNYEMAGNFHVKRFSLQNKSYLEDYNYNFKEFLKKTPCHPGIEKSGKRVNWYDFIKTSINIIFKIPFTFFYRILSNYGESYIRSFFSFIFILIIFSFIYPYTEIAYKPYNTSELLTLQDYSLTALKYGFLFSLKSSIPIRFLFENIQAYSDLSAVISGLQFIIQTMNITLFIISLKRKFRR